MTCNVLLETRYSFDATLINIQPIAMEARLLFCSAITVWGSETDVTLYHPSPHLPLPDNMALALLQYEETEHYMNMNVLNVLPTDKAIKLPLQTCTEYVDIILTVNSTDIDNNILTKTDTCPALPATD
jgi:hypothetical protein